MLRKNSPLLQNLSRKSSRGENVNSKCNCCLIIEENFIIDEVIMKIVEAVDPIVPITLRDKALESGYLRTALQFLGAAEFMFAQYETDVRTQANPNGVVGYPPPCTMNLRERSCSMTSSNL